MYKRGGSTGKSGARIFPLPSRRPAAADKTYAALFRWVRKHVVGFQLQANGYRRRLNVQACKWNRVSCGRHAGAYLSDDHRRSDSRDLNRRALRTVGRDSISSRNGWLAQASRQLAASGHQTLDRQFLIVVSVEDQMDLEGRANAKRAQPMEGRMSKMTKPPQAGMGGEFLQGAPHRVEVSPRDRFTRFNEIPLVLVVEIAQEIVRAPEQTTHALRRNRCSRSARSATASRSALMSGECGP